MSAYSWRAWSRMARAARPFAATGAGVGFGWAMYGDYFGHCDVGKPWHTVTVLKSEKHTWDTKKITFSLPPEFAKWGDHPIANVLVRADCAAEESGKVVRPYNPLSVQTEGHLQLLVKSYKDSKMGSKLHSLRPGDTVEMKGPNQQWTFEKGKYGHYGFLAGGTGITPIIQNLMYILRHDTNAKVTLVTFNKTRMDILLRDEINALKHSFPDRFYPFFVVDTNWPISRRADDDQVYDVGAVPIQETEKITPGLLRNLLPPPSDQTMVMVCGRGEMTSMIAGPKNADWTQGEVGGLLKQLGYTESMVWKI